MEDVAAVPKVRIAFGARVRQLRQESNWSQKDLAAQMNAAGFKWRQTTATKVEAGERPVPVEEAVALAQLFDVTVDSLLRPTNERPLTGLIDRWFRTKLATEREARAKLQEHREAQTVSELAQSRVNALLGLETYMDGDTAAFGPAINATVRYFHAEWIDILVQIGYDRSLLEHLNQAVESELRRELRREGKELSPEDETQRYADLVAEHLNRLTDGGRQILKYHPGLSLPPPRSEVGLEQHPTQT